MAQLKGKYILDGTVTLAKLADMATESFIGRTTSGTGVPEVLSKADALQILNVEDGADVTDEANVVSALDGATLTAVTVSGTDKVLVQDADDSSNLKTVTAQSIADLGGGGEVKKVEVLTIGSGDITAKYKDLAEVPVTATAVEVFPVGGITQEYTVDFTIITNGSVIKRLNWNGLGLEALLEANDKLIVSYTY
jgi:hypothetical protein